MSNSMMMTRRGLLVGGAAMLALGGCTNAVGTNGAAQLDARVDETHQYLVSAYPAAAPVDAAPLYQVQNPIRW